MPHALAFGSAFYAALAAHYREKQAGGSHTGDELVSVFGAAWADHGDRGVPLEVVDGAADALDLGRRMLGAFVADDAARGAEVIDVERPVSAVLHNPDTEEQLRHDVQLTAYQLALRQEGVDNVGLRFQVFTKGEALRCRSKT